MKSHVSEQKLGHLRFEVFQILSPELEYVLIEKKINERLKLAARSLGWYNWGSVQPRFGLMIQGRMVILAY